MKGTGMKLTLAVALLAGIPASALAQARPRPRRRRAHRGGDRRDAGGRARRSRRGDRDRRATC